MTLFRENDKNSYTRTIVEDDEEYEDAVVEYKASAKVVKQRLDIMGFSLKNVTVDFESMRANKILELTEYVSESPEGYWQEELTLYQTSTFEDYLEAFKVITDSGIHPVYYLKENPDSSKLIFTIH